MNEKNSSLHFLDDEELVKWIRKIIENMEGCDHAFVWDFLLDRMHLIVLKNDPT